MLNQDLIVIGLLAFIAGLILFRLYSTFGRRTGAEPPPAPARAGSPAGDLPRFGAQPAPAQGPVPANPAGEGVMAILRADPSFDMDKFVKGARAAYERILNAFAKGDRETLQPLLTPRVFETFAKAIAEREQKGEPGPELVRLRRAEVTDAALEGQMARIGVKFEAELAHGPEGVRDGLEKWTFERDVRSADPNWKLARVSAA
ncbi:MAG TPA: Tim44/TimA family putative adaptor protein [Caulobacterales bacterium]|nr:Tim44/TimA family putative adaptor protein [Caulobacterales bacterium]